MHAGPELCPYHVLAHAQLSVLYLALLAGAALTMASMFFNEMLVASLYVYFLVAALCALRMPRSTHVVARSAVLAAVAVAFKVPQLRSLISSLCSCGDLSHLFLVLQVGSTWALGMDDDAHIFVILRAHMTSYEDFVTLQYLCGMAYNPMPAWVFANLTTTLVLPLGLSVLALLGVKTLVDWKDGAPKDPAVVFLFALVCMAALRIGKSIQ